MGACKKTAGPKLDDTKVMLLYMRGLTDEEIGRKLDVVPDTVAKWRGRHGLAKNGACSKKKDKSLSPLAADAMAARELGLSYGQFKAQQHDGQIEEQTRQNAIFAARKRAKADREAAEAAARAVPAYGGGFDFEVIGNEEGAF